MVTIEDVLYEYSKVRSLFLSLPQEDRNLLYAEAMDMIPQLLSSLRRDWDTVDLFLSDHPNLTSFTEECLKKHPSFQRVFSICQRVSAKLNKDSEIPTQFIPHHSHFIQAAKTAGCTIQSWGIFDYTLFDEDFYAEVFMKLNDKHVQIRVGCNGEPTEAIKQAVAAFQKEIVQTLEKLPSYRLNIVTGVFSASTLFTPLDALSRR